MNVKGVDVCFGKVVRLTLYGGGQSVVLLYAPQMNELYNANIEATVEDIANPMRKNNELGFTAQITITNPPAEAVELISRHIGWIAKANETKEQVERKVIENLNEVLLDYYSGRVRCKLEVGYWDYSLSPKKATFNKSDDEYVLPRVGWGKDEKEPADIPGLVTLFDGYINGSSLYHEKTDDILKLACHNYNVDEVSTRAIKEEIMCILPDAERKEKLERVAKDDFAKRSGYNKRDWESMFRQLVSGFAMMRPNPNYGSGVQEKNGMPYSVPSEIPVSKKDREQTEWIEIHYIKSPNDLNVPDEALRTRLQDYTFPIQDFYTNAGTLPDMLTDLSNHRNANVNWMQYDEYDGKHQHAVFFVWERGAGLGPVSVRAQSVDAHIKIINYQNLLESPAANQNGALRIRMFLNTECIPLRRIALILDPDIGSDTGTGDSFVVNQSTLFRESMGVNGKLTPFVGAQQLANAMSVYMEEVAAKDIVDRGYLFNTGFPIVKATHKIATLGPEWETVVETIPVYNGLNVNFGGN